MLEKVSLFCFGALGYGGLELLYRGHTHWTMLLAGGICMLCLYALNQRLSGWPLLMRCAAGSALITTVEFSFGLVFNRWLHLAVWDYSACWGNLLGQICPFYSFLWFLLCIPLFFCFSYAQKAPHPQDHPLM